MKKLLAICLTVFMVISLMPAVFAADAVTISATGATWFEGESYRTGVVYRKGATGTITSLSTEDKYIASGSSFHGGKAMNRYLSLSNPATNSVAYVEIPVTVAADGDYKITLSAPQTATQDTRVYVGDASSNYTKVLETTRAGADGAASVPTTFFDSISYAHLTTDITKLKFEVTLLKSSGYLMYSWDYIKIEPKATETVSASETTRIEAENYPIYDNSVKNYRNRVIKNDSYSDGKYIQFYQNTAINTYTQLDIPFTVAEDGLYTIKTKLAHIAASSVIRSNQTIKLDGEELKKLTKPSGTATVWEEIVINNKFISAGKTHTITVLAGADSGYSLMAVDYVEFVPFVSGSVEVPASGALTVQAEDYTKSCINVTKADGTKYVSVLTGSSAAVSGKEGENYLSVDFNNASYAAGTNTWVLDFTVPVDGNYRIMTSHSGATADHVKSTSALVDGEQLFKDTTNGVINVMQLDVGVVNLKAGKHTYEFVAEFKPYNARIALDYVSFKLLDMPVDLNETETVRIEAEDVSLKCDSCAIASTITYDASGNATLNYPDTAHYHPAYADFVVNAPVAGDYTFKAYVLNPTNHGHLDLLVNGTVKTGFEDVNSESGWATKAVTIPLNEGENTVTVRVRVENGYTYFGLDYVEFTKAEEEPEPTVTPDSVSYASGEATVYVNFVDAGKAIVAFYGADGALVGITSADVEAAGVIEATVTCAAAPTVCKAFVWDGFTNATPIGVHKIIPIN